MLFHNSPLLSPCAKDDPRDRYLAPLALQMEDSLVIPRSFSVEDEPNLLNETT